MVTQVLTKSLLIVSFGLIALWAVAWFLPVTVFPGPDPPGSDELNCRKFQYVFYLSIAALLTVLGYVAASFRAATTRGRVIRVLYLTGSASLCYFSLIAWAFCAG